MSLIQRVERAQRLAENPEAVEIVAVPPPAPPSPSRVAMREELLRDLRFRLQDEVMGAFDTLLDISDPAELRTKV